ncbi:hypothetical protein [Streptomyces hygroscopicus]|uniref:hypothetical protein n=1 Tax=Streptomyces hygroscopicus TaxID=1912 RepID=UPI00223FB757|nr:hypothetical protein [Streptomyces hygroscopicus]
MDAAGSTGHLVELGELVFRARETDLEFFGFAEPAFPLGLGDAVDEVVAAVDEPRPLVRIWSQE